MSSPDGDTDAILDAGDYDAGVPMPRPLAEAVDRFAAFGIYGLVWLTRDLIVENAFGALVDFVTVGQPVTESFVALHGLENDILALRETPDRVLELPAIAVATGEGGAQRKLNFTIFWLTKEDKPTLLAYRANSQTELEMELSKQIRARLMTEADLASKSRELERANADLESFAAIVSHDLKAPLRHIRLLADDLLVELGCESAFAGKLQQLQDLARRMSHMLTELFEYASLGRKYEALMPTDTQALARAVAASCPQSGFAIEVTGHWPVISTLVAPLDLVLRNLVQNALQHHDRETGRVVLSCHEDQESFVFEVSDDGPGIPVQHHGAIYRPFRTLDRPGQRASGTGMGLAMVKKTVEAAGGSIALVSDPTVARGSRFMVHWPKSIRL